MSILEIANTSCALGEMMLDEKLVRKILRSLPNKYDMKVTAIEKAQDISNMKIDELIGSLQTFELVMIDRPKKKSRSINFISNTYWEDVQCEVDTDEIISDAIVLLGRQFNQVLKRMDMKSKPNVKNMSFNKPSVNNMSFDYIKNNGFQHKGRTEEKQNQGKGVQYHEC